MIAPNLRAGALRPRQSGWLRAEEAGQSRATFTKLTYDHGVWGLPAGIECLAYNTIKLQGQAGEDRCGKLVGYSYREKVS
jgi:hypothetical protein